MKVENEYPFLLSLTWEHSDYDSDCCMGCSKSIKKEEPILYALDTGDCFCLECGIKIIEAQQSYINSFLPLVKSLSKNIKEYCNE